MKTSLGFAALLLALFAPPASRGSAAEAPGAPTQPAVPSNTVSADRTVEVMWEPSASPPDITHILARLFGADAGDIGSRLMNVKPAAARRAIETGRSVTVKDHACTVSFAVYADRAGDGARPAATEFADALVEQLSARLEEDRRRQSERRLNVLKDEFAERQVALESLRREIRQQAQSVHDDLNRADVSPGTIQAAAGKLEDERQRIELDLAGMDARLGAVQEQMKAAEVRGEKQASADPVIEELEKAVAAREKVVDLTRRRFEAGSAPQTEVTAAEAELADAKIKLLDRRAAASSRGADALAPLTRELQNLTIDIRDRKARLAAVRERLKPLRKAVQSFQELEWKGQEEAVAAKAWEEANARFREAQRVADTLPVDRVIVTSASDGTAAAPTAK